MFANLRAKIFIRLMQRFGHINRYTLAAEYLIGTGIEIGAMDYPLPVKNGVKVKYLDRCTKDESAKIFPDLKSKLVDVDILDDGETLFKLKNEEYDFVIANHFLEHCQNPIYTIKNILRVVKRGGVIFMAIPDKRYTFDKDREVTTSEHLIKDFENGSSNSEEFHYYDFVSKTSHGKGKTEEEITVKINELKERNFSIHFHVWDHQAMLDMFIMLKNKYELKFEIQAAVSASSSGNESVFVLKKW